MSARGAYDFLVVGAGMFGSVFARCAAERGRRVLVLDRREHIGGNCYTEQVSNIHVHKYGAHIFHTNCPRIWGFMRRFSKFNSYVHCVRVWYKGKIYSFPINLMTLHQLWGVTTPAQAQKRMETVRVHGLGQSNAEEWLLSQVGTEIYEIFFAGYTRKQWRMDASKLPASIVKRIPIRFVYDERYFTDRFQGIPADGYTSLFQRLLDHKLIETRLGVDYLRDGDGDSTISTQVVFTGRVDELFGYKYGYLPYRSLRFETEVRAGDYQGTAVMNYTEESVPYTRIIEHRHFDPACNEANSVITREYPEEYERTHEAYYPVRTVASAECFERYAELAKQAGIILGGRLASFQYYDMHHVVGQAMRVAKEIA